MADQANSTPLPAILAPSGLPANRTELESHLECLAHLADQLNGDVEVKSSRRTAVERAINYHRRVNAQFVASTPFGDQQDPRFTEGGAERCYRLCCRERAAYAAFLNAIATVEGERRQKLEYLEELLDAGRIEHFDGVDLGVFLKSVRMR